MAARIALAHDSHLIALALTGVARLIYPRPPQTDPDPRLKLHLDILRAQARQALSSFEAQAAALALPSFEQRVVDDEAGGGVSLLARYADLVVIGQINPAQPSSSVMRDFPAYVLLHCGRPVLIVPDGPVLSPAWTARRILIAWNASKEASRAVSAALPFLKQAEQVEIAIVNPEFDGAELVRYLTRHGVRSSVIALQAGQEVRRATDVSRSLLAVAAEHAADVLVMGAFGHSRLRESILSGVTLLVLKTMTLPVLMTH